MSELNALTNTVATKANQSALDTTNTTVPASCSERADPTRPTGRAPWPTDCAACPQPRSPALSSALRKADLSGGRYRAGGQLPNNIPASKITGIEATLTNKADLVGGVVPVGQIPAIPTSRVTNLDTTLANKADLVGGLVPTSQLPALAYNTTVVVGSEAAMLGLTPAQVQPGDICVISTGPDQGATS